MSKFLDFHWSAISHTLVPYFFETYKLVWLIFLVTGVWALRLKWRHFIGPLAIASGMAVSIFLLYGSIWKDIEFGSGMRYLLHGMYGWTIYFFIVMTNASNDRILFLRTLQDQTDKKATAHEIFKAAES